MAGTPFAKTAIARVRKVCPLILLIASLSPAHADPWWLPEPPPPPPVAAPIPPPPSPPVPPPLPPAPERDVRGTDQSPLVVRVQPSPRSPSEDARDQRERDDRAAADWWIVRLTAVLGALALLQLLAFALQAFRLRQTVRAMQESSERQLRAYVFVAAARIENYGVGQVPRAKLTIRNSGQTPAVRLINRASLGFDTFPPNVTPPMEKGDAPPSRPLPPGSEFLVQPSLGRALNSDDVEGLKAGSVALYVTGTIQYHDAFDQPHVTEYRLFAGGSAGLGGEMAGYDEGNRAT